MMWNKVQLFMTATQDRQSLKKPPTKFSEANFIFVTM